MPKITVNGKSFEVEKGERLVLALERSGIPIGHHCGGKAECTTCQVKFLEGEPDMITEAEYVRLFESDLLGKARLSCQIEVDRDMTLEVIHSVAQHPEWNGDPGPEPDELVEPEAVWYPVEDIYRGKAE